MATGKSVAFLSFRISVALCNKSSFDNKIDMMLFQLMNAVLLSTLLLISISNVHCFSPLTSPIVRCRSPTSLKMSLENVIAAIAPRIISTLQLADTSISEEEVLNTVGQVGDLPDPFFTVVVAGVIVLGVAVLQFSLGDLTKEVTIVSW